MILLTFVMVTTILLTDKGLNNALPEKTFAQLSGNVTSTLNKTQEWISLKDNVKILFTYQPERPVIDTFTKLEFSVINLTNNENLKEFDARVVVTNGQRLFKFENITVPDGDFSVEYLFPDDGTHQVITRVDKDAAVQVLASFNVFVPHQTPPSLLNPFPNTPSSEIESITRVLSIVISFSIIIVVVIMLRKGKGKQKRRRQRLGYYE
jgi:biopolymer transport protein ExbD